MISIETAQSGLDLGVLDSLAGKTIILGVLDLSTDEVETPDTVAARIRRAFPHTERLIAAPDCGMKYLRRDAAYGKLESLVEGARLGVEQRVVVLGELRADVGEVVRHGLLAAWSARRPRSRASRRRGRRRRRPRARARDEELVDREALVGSRERSSGGAQRARQVVGEHAPLARRDPLAERGERALGQQLGLLPRRARRGSPTRSTIVLVGHPAQPAPRPPARPRRTATSAPARAASAR